MGTQPSLSQFYFYFFFFLRWKHSPRGSHLATVTNQRMEELGLEPGLSDSGVWVLSHDFILIQGDMNLHCGWGESEQRF